MSSAEADITGGGVVADPLLAMFGDALPFLDKDSVLPPPPPPLPPGFEVVCVICGEMGEWGATARAPSGDSGERHRSLESGNKKNGMVMFFY